MDISRNPVTVQRERELLVEIRALRARAEALRDEVAASNPSRGASAVGRPALRLVPRDDRR